MESRVDTVTRARLGSPSVGEQRHTEGGGAPSRAPERKAPRRRQRASRNPDAIDDRFDLAARDERGKDGDARRRRGVWRRDRHDRREPRRPEARQRGQRILVDDVEPGRRFGPRGRRPRQRCEAEEYDAERPPPGRKSVGHCSYRLPSYERATRRRNLLSQ